MRITLIGMSNIGKTYWSRRLEKIGFKRFGCDDMIEEKLGIKDVARWLGQPFEHQYKANSSTYLRFEREVLISIIDYLKNQENREENIVVDTTGSVIYTGDDIMERLSALTTIVLLDTKEEAMETMYESYIRNPKPVIWGESYKKINGESDKETLQLCYPRLLKYRSSRYKKTAHVVIESETIREVHFDAYDFLKLFFP